MTGQKTWGEVGREVLKKLKGLTDEASIKALGEETMRQVLAQEATPEGRANAIKMIGREIMNKKDGFPRLESEAPNYWYDPKGKKSDPRWRHLIFKTINRSTSDSDEIGDAARKEWKAQQQEETDQQQKETEQQIEPVKPVSPALEAMTINQFQLDGESHQLVQDAMTLSGMTLDEFTRQAIKVYAKTITGRNKAASEDLSAVPTGELLTDSKYSTHPGRATELTKRAIQAIKIYNTEIATEPSDHWMITASAIATLIGSRQSTIKEIMQQFQTSIDDNNLNPEWNLTPYSNRKPGKKIEEIIKLTEFVPDGLA